MATRPTPGDRCGPRMCRSRGRRPPAFPFRSLVATPRNATFANVPSQCLATPANPMFPMGGMKTRSRRLAPTAFWALVLTPKIAVVTARTPPICHKRDIPIMSAPPGKPARPSTYH